MAVSAEPADSGLCRQVFDQYVHFISLEKDMFVLRHHDNETTSYYGTVLNYSARLLLVEWCLPLSTSWYPDENE